MRKVRRRTARGFALAAPLAAASLLVAPPALRAQTAPGDGELPAWLAKAIDGPLERAHWGVAVYDLGSGRWIATHDADRHFVPASNLKLLVSAAALERLGPEYAWRTSLYGTAPVGGDSTLRGDLVLYGRGDPNLSGRFAGSTTAVLEALADSLLARGLRRVTGGLMADASHWDDEPLRPEWESYDTLWWYAAPVGALGFNDNSIDFAIRPGKRVGDPPVVQGSPASAFWSLDNRATTGPPGAPRTFDLRREPGTNRVIAYGVFPLDADPRTEYFAVVDPAAWTGTVFREVLAAKGIVVEGPVVTVADPAVSAVARGDTVALAAWTSPPLAKVVETINGRSQNWHAEQLLKTLGKEVAGEGSWSAGLRVERETLASLGVDTTAFLLHDASGLASGNLVTPEALVDLLAAVRRRPWSETFVRSLPIAAGETGSLRRRFVNTVGAGRVRGKTGFIENVYALSGYLTTLDGRELAYSVIVNQTGRAGGQAPDAIDRLINAFVAGEAP